MVFGMSLIRHLQLRARGMHLFPVSFSLLAPMLYSLLLGLSIPPPPQLLYHFMFRYELQISFFFNTTKL